LSGCPTNVEDTVTVDDVRQIVAPLPRSYEVVVRDRIKVRIRQIVYLAFSRDETVMGFANWVHVRLDAIEHAELREIVVEAWRMCVPKSVAATVP
jgi:hypothetical protein